MSTFVEEYVSRLAPLYVVSHRLFGYPRIIAIIPSSTDEILNVGGIVPTIGPTRMIDDSVEFVIGVIHRSIIYEKVSSVLGRLAMYLSYSRISRGQG